MLRNGKGIEEKLERVLEGQREIVGLLEELREKPGGDRFQQGIDAILGYKGPKGGGEE